MNDLELIGLEKCFCWSVPIKYPPSSKILQSPFLHWQKTPDASCLSSPFFNFHVFVSIPFSPPPLLLFPVQHDISMHCSSVLFFCRADVCSGINSLAFGAAWLHHWEQMIPEPLVTTCVGRKWAAGKVGNGFFSQSS